MTPNPDTLAAWLESEADGLDGSEGIPCVGPNYRHKFREAAAALRSLTAERDEAISAFKEKVRDFSDEMKRHHETAERLTRELARLRRKVARYIGKAREQRERAEVRNDEAWSWMMTYNDTARERDEARGERNPNVD